MPPNADVETANRAWLDKVLLAERTVKEVATLAAKMPGNPFEALSRVKEVIRKLEDSGLERLAPPAELLVQLNAACLRERAEFWDRLAEGCATKEWKIEGSTDRRIINRGVIIDLAEQEVRVDELSLRFVPHAASVMKGIQPEVQGLIPSGFDPQKFMALLTAAYDMLPGGKEKPLELVYRVTFLLSQKSSFWKGLHAGQIVRLTRPAFRARLAQLLVAGLRAADGRELRFGTTVVAKDAWEVYSPGEERLVQVGRISIA
jgi:hypothetical protein